MTKELPYVANQLTPEGLDEVQQLALAYHLRQNLAISGPPGVGKTVLIEYMNMLTGKEVVRITCDEMMTESALVGFPSLEGNGSSHTVWKNGAVTQAMADNQVFYGDEFDQLPGALQKRLDSVLDDAREIRRRDNVLIKAGPEFAFFISYNPTRNLSQEELEEAVGDRFEHLHFTYLPPELEAALAIKDVSAVNTEQRAVFLTENGLQFYRRDGKLWKPCFDGSSVNGQGLPEEATVYHIHKRDGVWKGKGTEADVAYGIAKFFVPVRSLADNGTNGLDATIRNQLGQTGEVTAIDLHKPSTRIIKAAMGQYDQLLKMGMSEEQAKHHAARVCVNQITRGRYGVEKIGQTTVREAVEALAQHYGLLPAPVQNTSGLRKRSP